MIFCDTIITNLLENRKQTWRTDDRKIFYVVICLNSAINLFISQIYMFLWDIICTFPGCRYTCSLLAEKQRYAWCIIGAVGYYIAQLLEDNWLHVNLQVLPILAFFLQKPNKS